MSLCLLCLLVGRPLPPSLNISSLRAMNVTDSRDKMPGVTDLTQFLQFSHSLIPGSQVEDVQRTTHIPCSSKRLANSDLVPSARPHPSPTPAKPAITFQAGTASHGPGSSPHRPTGTITHPAHNTVPLPAKPHGHLKKCSSFPRVLKLVFYVNWVFPLV